MSAAGQSKADLIAMLEKFLHDGIVSDEDCAAAFDALQEAHQLVGQCVAALASEPEPQPVAEGWVLVPKEATKPMREAIHCVRQAPHNAARAYRAMLLASPHQAETAPDQEGQTDAAIRSLTAPDKEGA